MGVLAQGESAGIDGQISDIRAYTQQMQRLAQGDGDAWEDLVQVAQQRHLVIEQVFRVDLPDWDRKGVLLTLQDIIAGDRALMAQCRLAQGRVAESLQAFGRAQYAQHRYQSTA